MAIDVHPPAGESGALNILKGEVLEILLLNHFFIVSDLMFSLHGLGIRFECHAIVLDLSMAECSDIHYMGRHTFILLRWRIYV